MNLPAKTTILSTSLLAFLTYVPVLLSLLSFYQALFATHPIQRFLLGLAPWWMTYTSARWYVRLAETSSPLYHPFGCLSQCCVWVLHWVISLYHACFATKYTFWMYLITAFCPIIVVVTEGMFHSLVSRNTSDTAYLGSYEKARKVYGRSLVGLVKLWYLVDVGTAQHQDTGQMRWPTQTRSMTM